jgi:opacity protein-like surface antigen
MLKHVSWKLPLILLLGIAAIPLHPQTVPEATRGNIPLTIGGGISDYLIDWGFGRRMEGATVWVDYSFADQFHLLHGIGIEAEGRDINWNRPSNLPKMRQDTGQGGLTYTWVHLRNLDPYAKMLGGIGSIDFPVSKFHPGYSHDTFSVFSPGGGAEYRIRNRVFVRADYEYQFWHQTFGPHDLNPNGITIGATYHLSRTSE